MKLMLHTIHAVKQFKQLPRAPMAVTTIRVAPSNNGDLHEDQNQALFKQCYNRAHEALMCVLKMMSICGANPHRKVGFWKYFTIFRSIVGTLLIWFFGLRYIATFSPDDEFGPEFFNKVCLLINGIASAICYSLLIFTSKHFHALVDRWESYSHDNAAIWKYANRLAWFVKVWIAIIVFAFVGLSLGIFVAGALGALDQDIFYLIIYPFGELSLSETEELILLFFCQLLYMLIVVALMTLVCSNTCFSYLVFKEFDHVTQQVAILVTEINQSDERTQLTRNNDIAKLRKR